MKTLDVTLELKALATPLELVGETLTFLESDGNGNWYTNEDAEEIYISNSELRGDAPHFTWK